MNNYQQEMNNLMSEIQPIGKEIGEQARLGNTTAQKIINYYKMLEKCFDGITFVLLQEAVKEYKNIK